MTVQAPLPAEAFTPVEDVAAPAGMNNTPLVGLFVGRRDELDDLDEVLLFSGERIMVLHGLGGTGKSTLAAQWAGDCAADWDLVWWIAADTPEADGARWIWL